MGARGDIEMENIRNLNHVLLYFRRSPGGIA